MSKQDHEDLKGTPEGNKQRFITWMKETGVHDPKDSALFHMLAATIGLSSGMPVHQVSALLSTYLPACGVPSGTITVQALELQQAEVKRHTFTSYDDLYGKLRSAVAKKLKHIDPTPGKPTVINESDLDPPRLTVKDTNPKDAVGVKKGRSFSSMSWHVNRLVGLGMLEGARKYGRHNYRVAGVRSSVYFDATLEHLTSWWEGEDVDPDSGLSHIIKAICSLYVLADAEISGMLNDDRPPVRRNVTEFKTVAQKLVDEIFARVPNAVAAYTKND